VLIIITIIIDYALEKYKKILCLDLASLDALKILPLE
jgi:hypothetical protein